MVIDIETFDENKHQEELEDVLNQEIAYLESLLNKKSNEIRQYESSLEKLRVDVREMKAKIEKKKIAKSIILDERIPKMIKKFKPKANDKKVRIGSGDMNLEHIKEPSPVEVEILDEELTKEDKLKQSESDIKKEVE
jgi:hypothetical protein